MKLMGKTRFLLMFVILIFASIFYTDHVYAKEPEPEQVRIGLYLNNIANIDLVENTFVADFYVWFKWKGNFDPTKTYEFTNSYEKWSLTQTLAYDEPKLLPDGSKYQTIRVEGKFVCKFDLHAYPLDVQALSIEIEDNKYHSKDMLYLVDNKETDFRKETKVPGWKITNLSADTFIYDYKTNFGDNTRDIQFEKYSRFRYTIDISRPQMLFLFKNILPIFIVLISVFTVFYIHPFYIEVRSGIIITALLSAVALQITASSDLGSVGYMVLIDKIYNLSYTVTLLALIETVIAIRYKDIGIAEKAIKLDRLSFKVLGIGSILCTIFIIIGR